jgi:C-terminal processing protease CtpA/Prc
MPTPPLVPLPGEAMMPAPMPEATDGESQGGTGTWVASLGLEFVPTSSGAMVLTNKAGSIAAAKGIEGGDFIESADGVSIKGLSEAEMAAKIASAKLLHLIAAGDVRVR